MFLTIKERNVKLCRKTSGVIRVGMKAFLPDLLINLQLGLISFIKKIYYNLDIILSYTVL